MQPVKVLHASLLQLQTSVLYLLHCICVLEFSVFASYLELYLLEKPVCDLWENFATNRCEGYTQNSCVYCDQTDFISHSSYTNINIHMYICVYTNVMINSTAVCATFARLIWVSL